MPEFISILRWIRDIVYPKALQLENTISNLPDQITGGYSQEYIDTLESSIMENIKPLDTIADLKTMKIPVDKIWVTGYHTKNDGAFGSHIFRLKGVKTTEIDNGGTVIVATIGGVNYVYELQYDGAVNVKFFGAKGDGVTDDTFAIQSAINASKILEIKSLSYITSELIAEEDLIIYGHSNGGFICDDVATIGRILSCKKNAILVETKFKSIAVTSVIEESVIGDLVRFDYLPVSEDLTIQILGCEFTNAKNDSISVGTYTGTGNNVKLVDIHGNTFNSSGRYDVTVRNANNALASKNTSFNAGGFWDSEPSGLTNNMENVSVEFNVVSEAAYNGIQISAEQTSARGIANISNNIIELNSSYVPTVAPKQPLAVRTNECSILGNSITGTFNRILDCNSTNVSFSGNTVKFNSLTGLEMFRLSNSSILDAKGNSITALSTLVNGEVNADSSSKYSFLNHNCSTMIIGGKYENILKIFGNNGLTSRAKIEIGDLQIDTTGLAGSEYVSLRSKASNKTVIQFDNLGRIKMLNVPTSSTGLTTGHIWNDGGILKII